MEKRYLLESVMGETRLAVLEDGKLCEMHLDRPGEEKLTGSLYLGRVQNILPGMNAAFVDIGLEKNAFLYAGDIPLDSPEIAARVKETRIERMIRPGQEILVQVIKEPGGTKGCRISSHITIPGRSTVLLPTMSYAGVSKKIADPEERERLYVIARRISEETGMGMIARTAAEGADEETLRRDYDRTRALWREIDARARCARAPKKIDSGGSLPMRMARDMLDESVCAIEVDGEGLFEETRRYVHALAPQYENALRLHTSETPLFDLYRVDGQMERAMSRLIRMKSGGTLVVDETEALTVIDVNTGKFVGKKSLDDTIFKLNCEAAAEIARLIRLRDVGGIIVIDFIDMILPEQREALLNLLREKMKEDRNRTNVVGFTGLGLVEMTRKKVRPPVMKQLMHQCPTCMGAGIVESHETTARRAIRLLWTRARQGGEGAYLIEAAPPVAGWIQKIGVPDGVRAYLMKMEQPPEGGFRLSPADERAISGKAIRLK